MGARLRWRVSWERGVVFKCGCQGVRKWLAILRCRNRNGSRSLAVKPDRDRPLIPNLNCHRSTKYPTCDSKPIASKSILEVLKETFCNYWRRGIGKTGTAAPAHIGIERELRDDQNFSAGIEERAVHLAFFVAEDAHMDNLISQSLYLNLAIGPPYSKKYQKSLTYLADYFPINGYTGTAYSL